MTHHHTTPRRRLVAAVLVAALAAACTPFESASDDESGDDDATPAPATVTIPPARLSPFCQAMIDLADRLENDPPDDVAAEIIETYESIVDEVPAAIRDDFDLVLADLRGEPVPTAASTGPTTTLPPDPEGDAFFDEGYDPEDTPALRLNAYVDFECRDVANNPGPPPTQPLSEVTTTSAE